MQQLRHQLRPHLIYLLLAILLGLGDLLLLAGASGIASQGPSRAEQDRRLQQVKQRLDATKEELAKGRFPKAQEMENLVLVLADMAQKSEVQIANSTALTKQEPLAGRQVSVVENNMDVRGSITGLVDFLDQVRTTTGNTQEVTSVNLRQDGRTWVLQLLVRVYTEP